MIHKLLFPLAAVSTITMFQCAFSQWVQTSFPVGSAIFILTSHQDTIYAGADSIGLFSSTNNGSDWNNIGATLPNRSVISIATSGEKMFTGTGGFIFSTTNGGATWDTINNGLEEQYPWLLSLMPLLHDTLLFAANAASGLYKSSNDGAEWKRIDSGWGNNSILTLAVLDSLLYVGVANAIYKTTDKGSNWEELAKGITFDGIRSLVLRDSIVIFGTKAGVHYSTNHGSNWYGGSNPELINCWVNALAMTGQHVFAGTDQGIYYSNNYSSWSNVSLGLPQNCSIQSLLIYGNYILAGTVHDGIWRRPLSEVLTSLHDAPFAVPMDFSLGQNFPNPFNPATTIEYTIPAKGFVSLSVSDILGRNIKTLIYEQQEAGKYRVSFNSMNVSSGIYFYSLTWRDQTLVKKCILQK